MVRAREELLRVQVGKETTPGTLVAATSILAQLTDIRYGPMDEVDSPATKRGSLALYDDVTVLGTGGQLNLSGILTFEDILYLLEAGYKTDTAAADAGTPIAYTREYAPTLTAEDTPKTLSLEAGTNTEAWAMKGGVVTSFDFTAQVRAFTRFNAALQARSFVSQAFTGSLTRRAVERLKAQKWQVYIDPTSNAHGTTEVTSCITQIDFRSGNLYSMIACINGSEEFDDQTQMGQGPEVTLTFQLDAATVALFADYRAGTKKYLRLKNLGTLIHGTPDVFKTVQIDMAASIMEWPETGGQSQQGALTIPLTFRGCEDVGGSFGALIEWTVINGLIAVP